MAQVLGDSANIAGGTSGALQTDFNDSVTNAFTTPPKAAMVFEGDFVGGVITSSTKAKAGTGYNVFPFPSITAGRELERRRDRRRPVRDVPRHAGDRGVREVPRDGAGGRGVGQAAAASRTGNKNVPASVYPDAITRADRGADRHRRSRVVFDMSDQQPASFGATAGQGEWGIFQDFLKTPDERDRASQKQLEAAAAAAYKKGK